MGLIRSGYTHLTVEDDDELTVLMWPIVREMIKTAIENEQHMIIDGCYLPFDWRKAIVLMSSSVGPSSPLCLCL